MNRQDLIAKLIEAGVPEDSAKSLADGILLDHAKIANDWRSKAEEKDKEINSLTESQKTLQSELDTKNDELATFGEVQERLTKSEATIADLEKQSALKDVRASVFDEVIKKNPVNAEDVMKFIDLDTLASTEDIKAEATKVVDGLVKDKSYLFHSELVQKGYQPQTSTGQLPPEPKKEGMTLNEQVEAFYTQNIPNQTNVANPLNVQE